MLSKAERSVLDDIARRLRLVERRQERILALFEAALVAKHGTPDEEPLVPTERPTVKR